MAVATASPPIGELLRSWRRRRSLSQLELSLNAAVSSRHLSFVETGRARPSREMLLHLAEHLEVPLRERNGLLLAAGYDVPRQIFVHGYLLLDDKKVAVPFLGGRELSKRRILMIVQTHMHEHLGQSIAYARSIGVTPPWTEAEQAPKK